MKRIDELVSLSHDHHAALVLARRCRQSAAGPDPRASADEAWRQVREAWSWHLEPHFLIEERTLLPALEEVGEHALCGRVREDHRGMRALAAAEAAMVDDVVRFGELLEAHVRFEERELFEVAQQKLAAERLAEVAEACRAHPRERPARP